MDILDHYFSCNVQNSNAQNSHINICAYFIKLNWIPYDYSCKWHLTYTIADKTVQVILHMQYFHVSYTHTFDSCVEKTSVKHTDHWNTENKKGHQSEDERQKDAPRFSLLYLYLLMLPDSAMSTDVKNAVHQQTITFCFSHT